MSGVQTNRGLKICCGNGVPFNFLAVMRCSFFFFFFFGFLVFWTPPPPPPPTFCILLYLYINLLLTEGEVHIGPGGKYSPGQPSRSVSKRLIYKKEGTSVLAFSRRSVRRWNSWSATNTTPERGYNSLSWFQGGSSILVKLDIRRYWFCGGRKTQKTPLRSVLCNRITQNIQCDCRKCMVLKGTW